jgi:hypothetical protein
MPSLFSRNANDTSRKRRKKCDERRPFCLTCEKSRWNCEGYEHSPAQTTSKILLPKSEGSSSSSIQPLPRPLPTPPTHAFQSTEEFCSFMFYCNETALQFSGIFEVPFWNRLILQATQDQPFIRHAIVTIGVLAHTLRTSVPVRDSEEYVNFSADQAFREHYEIILRHYTRFLEGARQAPTFGIQGTRTALIVCLLINCIENLQWRQVPAQHQVKTGIGLLEEWMKTTGNPRVLPVSSPKPSVIEDEIVEQLRMLELEGSVLSGPNSKEYQDRVRREGREYLKLMPPVFTDVREARKYLELIMRITQYFIGISPMESELQTPDSPEMKQTHSYTMSEGSQGLLPFDKEVYASENRRWALAFEPLYRNTRPEDPDFMSVTVLKMRSNTLTIVLAGEGCESEMVYDIFLPEFQEIIALATKFFQHPSVDKYLPDGAWNPSNLGIIFPLHITAIKCRNRKLRRDAIAMMQSKCWRETVMWSWKTGDLDMWLVTVEEQGISTEEIPEWARASKMNMVVESAAGNGNMTVYTTCVRGVGLNAQVRKQLVFDSSGRSMDSLLHGFQHG